MKRLGHFGGLAEALLRAGSALTLLADVGRIARRTQIAFLAFPRVLDFAQGFGHVSDLYFRQVSSRRTMVVVTIGRHKMFDSDLPGQSRLFNSKLISLLAG